MFDITFPAAFLAGLVSFLAPCTFVTVPYFLTFLGIKTFGTEEKVTKKQVVIATLLYIFGFLLVFTLLGFSASSLGGFLRQNKHIFLYTGGVLFLFFGFFITFGEHVFVLQQLLRDRKIQKEFGSISNSYYFPIIVGMTSAFAWTPCIGPILGSILFLASYKTELGLQGAALLFTYGVGIMLPFLILSIFVEAAYSFVQRFKKAALYVYKFFGVFLMILGVLILTGYFSIVFGSVYDLFVLLGYSPQ